MPELFFITNRVINEPKKRANDEEEREISFDLDDNTPEVSVYFCTRTGKGRYVELGSQKWFARVRQTEYNQVLFYIHGYSNLPEVDIFERAERLQSAFDAFSEKEVLVIPLIWPCDNDAGVIKDYFDDQKAADGSGLAFARVLEKFLKYRIENDPKGEHPCDIRMNILAHSMGNRVLRNTIAKWAKYERMGDVPMLFRNIFMVAADVVNETLHRDEEGYLITNTAKNVVVYYAADDLALRASKAANVANRIASLRLGHTGPEDMSKVSRNTYIVDCDSVNTQYDRPKGHTYFITKEGDPGKVFEHMAASIKTGRIQPNQKEHII